MLPLAPSQPFSQDVSQPEYNRVSCIHCRKNHKKCDRMLPSCGRCSKLNKHCVYANMQNLNQNISTSLTSLLSTSPQFSSSQSSSNSSPQTIISNFDTQGVLNQISLGANIVHTQFFEYCCLGCTGITPPQQILNLLYYSRSSGGDIVKPIAQMKTHSPEPLEHFQELSDSALLLSIQSNVLQCIGQKQMAKIYATQSEQQVNHLLSLSEDGSHYIPTIQYNLHVTLLYLCKFFLGTALQNDQSYQLFMRRVWYYLQTHPNLEMIELYAKIETIYKMLHCLGDPFSMMEIFAQMHRLPDSSNTLPQFEQQFEVQLHVGNIMKQVLQDLHLDKLKQSILVLEECVMLVMRTMEHILRQETYVNKMGFYNQRIIEFSGKLMLSGVKIQVLQDLFWQQQQQNLNQELVAFLRERVELACGEILELTRSNLFGYFNPTCIGPIHAATMYYLSVLNEENFSRFESSVKQLFWAMQHYEKRYDWTYRQPFKDSFAALMAKCNNNHLIA